MSALKKFAEAAQAAGLGTYQEPISLSGEAKAMTREAVKSIQSAFHQFAYGQPSGPGEPGTPLNPTPQIVTEELTGKQLEMDR